MNGELSWDMYDIDKGIDASKGAHAETVYASFLVGAKEQQESYRLRLNRNRSSSSLSESRFSRGRF